MMQNELFKRGVGVSALALIAACGLSMGCEQSDAEEAGDTLENALENTKDAAEDAADSAGDAIDDAADSVGDAMDDAADDAEDAVDDATGGG